MNEKTLVFLKSALVVVTKVLQKIKHSVPIVESDNVVNDDRQCNHCDN